MICGDFNIAHEEIDTFGWVDAFRVELQGRALQ
jgi:exonuclease III